MKPVETRPGNDGDERSDGFGRDVVRDRRRIYCTRGKRRGTEEQAKTGILYFPLFIPQLRLPHRLDTALLALCTSSIISSPLRRSSPSRASLPNFTLTSLFSHSPRIRLTAQLNSLFPFHSPPIDAASTSQLDGRVSSRSWLSGERGASAAGDGLAEEKGEKPTLRLVGNDEERAKRPWWGVVEREEEAEVARARNDVERARAAERCGSKRSGLPSTGGRRVR